MMSSLPSPSVACGYAVPKAFQIGQAQFSGNFPERSFVIVKDTNRSPMNKPGSIQESRRYPDR